MVNKRNEFGKIKPNSNQNKPQAPVWLFDKITEISKNSQRVYLLFISFITYCGITLLGISDRQIILNETIQLPLINSNISFRGFIILAPLISILVFVYLQLYMYSLKCMIDDLRSNYQFEKRRIYPWMLNIIKIPELGLMGKIQKTFVYISLWWFLPIVLCFFVLQSFRLNIPILYYLEVIISLMAGCIVIWFGVKMIPFN